MLLLDQIDLKTGRDATVAVDEYVPLTISIAYLGPAHTIYWQATPSIRTLVEVGLCSKTGRFRSITLTMIDPACVVKGGDYQKPAEYSETFGVPCFDLAGWPMTPDFTDRFREEDVAVRFVLANRHCALEFGQPCAVATVVKLGSVRFAFDSQKALVRIEVELLEEQQIETLRRVFG